MERGILTGIAAYRWAAWVWMATVLLLSRGGLAHPWVAYGLVAAALALTAALTGLLKANPPLQGSAMLTARRAGPSRLRRPVSRRGRLASRPAPALPRPMGGRLAPLGLIPVGSELALGASLVLLDGWVYPPGHAFSAAQSLGIAWPLAGVFTAGVAGGVWLGGAAGLLMGGARAGAAVLNGAGAFGHQEVLSLASTAVLYLLAGTVSGHVAGLLTRAEREVDEARAREEDARAREEVSRTLHDGVLQTLAVIERRAGDESLAALAREQERQLRDYIAGLAPSGPRDLAAALRAAATRFERAFGGRARVVIAPDTPAVAPERVDALAGAVWESLANAGKHGRAQTVTIFAEPAAGGLFCSVKDDGAGFDPATIPAGRGIGSSIRGRIEETGGRVELESRPGGPTEVRMWIPSE